jgi:hypothetical protein
MNRDERQQAERDGPPDASALEHVLHAKGCGEDAERQNRQFAIDRVRLRHDQARRERRRQKSDQDQPAGGAPSRRRQPHDADWDEHEQGRQEHATRRVEFTTFV